MYIKKYKKWAKKWAKTYNNPWENLKRFQLTITKPSFLNAWRLNLKTLEPRNNFNFKIYFVLLFLNPFQNTDFKMENIFSASTIKFVELWDGIAFFNC